MRHLAFLLGTLAAPWLLCAQTPAAKDGSAPAAEYTLPSPSERFHYYLRHTFSLPSLFEAGAHAGIDQARSAPSEWPEGAQGYAERFGSAAGGIVVRGTTEFGLSALFHEDLRPRPRGKRSIFAAALADTFTARKGDDGHTAFSFARLLGPQAGGMVESIWKPGGFDGHSAVRTIGLHYGLVFGRNLVKELFRH